MTCSLYRAKSFTLERFWFASKMYGYDLVSLCFRAYNPRPFHLVKVGGLCGFDKEVGLMLCRSEACFTLLLFFSVPSFFSVRAEESGGRVKSLAAKALRDSNDGGFTKIQDIQRIRSAVGINLLSDTLLKSVTDQDKQPISSKFRFEDALRQVIPSDSMPTTVTQLSPTANDPVIDRLITFLRDRGRELDVQADTLECQRYYTIADRLRQLAQSIREEARLLDHHSQSGQALDKPTPQPD